MLPLEERSPADEAVPADAQAESAPEPRWFALRAETGRYWGMQDPGQSYLVSLDEDKLEALVETMFLVAFADGDYGPEERAHFAQSVETLTDGRLTSRDFDHIVDRLVDALQRQGRQGCIASLKRRLDEPQLRQVALILAADMAAADGRLHDEERSLLVAMARELDLGEDATREAIEGPAR